MSRSDRAFDLGEEDAAVLISAVPAIPLRADARPGDDILRRSPMRWRLYAAVAACVGLVAFALGSVAFGNRSASGEAQREAAVQWLAGGVASADVRSDLLGLDRLLAMYGATDEIALRSLVEPQDVLDVSTRDGGPWVVSRPGGVPLGSIGMLDLVAVTVTSGEAPVVDLDASVLTTWSRGLGLPEGARALLPAEDPTVAATRYLESLVERDLVAFESVVVGGESHQAVEAAGALLDMTGGLEDLDVELVTVAPPIEGEDDVLLVGLTGFEAIHPDGRSMRFFAGCVATSEPDQASPATADCRLRGYETLGYVLPFEIRVVPVEGGYAVDHASTAVAAWSAVLASGGTDGRAALAEQLAGWGLLPENTEPLIPTLTEGGGVGDAGDATAPAAGPADTTDESTDPAMTDSDMADSDMTDPGSDGTGSIGGGQDFVGADPDTETATDEMVPEELTDPERVSSALADRLPEISPDALDIPQLSGVFDARRLADLGMVGTPADLTDFGFVEGVGRGWTEPGGGGWILLLRYSDPAVAAAEFEVFHAEALLEFSATIAAYGPADFPGPSDQGEGIMHYRLVSLSGPDHLLVEVWGDPLSLETRANELLLQIP